jgi:hypothetical protein
MEAFLEDQCGKLVLDSLKDWYGSATGKWNNMYS